MQCYESNKQENYAAKQSNIKEIIGKQYGLMHNDEIILSSDLEKSNVIIYKQSTDSNLNIINIYSFKEAS